MEKPNRKDLRRLVSIQTNASNLMSACSGLSTETRDFLRTEFNGETEIKLRDFERNITEVIEELKKPLKKDSHVRN